MQTGSTNWLPQVFHTIPLSPWVNLHVHIILVSTGSPHPWPCFFQQWTRDTVHSTNRKMEGPACILTHTHTHAHTHTHTHTAWITHTYTHTHTHTHAQEHHFPHLNKFLPRIQLEIEKKGEFDNKQQLAIVVMIRQLHVCILTQVHVRTVFALKSISNKCLASIKQLAIHVNA